jgi:hypothetical protein
MGVSAWFPLGPGEAYRPWYPCSPRYIDQVNISNISESPRVHVQTTYVNINVVNVTYVNRTIGVSAMNHADFAAGRSAHQATVVVDVHLFDHVQVLQRPEVQPNPHVFAGPPPVRPVRVNIARPVLINEKGKLTSAKPGAPPVEPPVKAAPPVRVLPGRTVVAPPPGAKTPPITPPVMMAPVAKPAQVAPPVAVPASKPIDRPMDRGAKPAAPPVTAPAAKPLAEPMEKPAAPPVVKNPPPPPTKPVAPPAPKPPMPPAAQPAPKPAPPAPPKPPQDRKDDKEKKDDKRPEH